jgi:hypothetical protein
VVTASIKGNILQGAQPIVEGLEDFEVVFEKHLLLPWIPPSRCSHHARHSVSISTSPTSLWNAVPGPSQGQWTPCFYNSLGTTDDIFEKFNE